MKDLRNITEADLAKFGIKSIMVISEPSFNPLFCIKFLDTDKEMLKFDELEKYNNHINNLFFEERKKKIEKILALF